MRVRPAIVLFTCLFAGQAVVLVLSPILPEVAAEFDMTTSGAAQLRAVSGLTAGIAALAMAAGGDRFRLRSLLYAGLTLIAGSSLLSAVAPEFWVLVVTHVAIGLALAMVVSGALAASEAWAPPDERTKVLSYALIGQPVSWIVGQPIVGLVADVDWRWAWIAVPFASAILALVVVARRDRRPETSSGGREPTGLWHLEGVRRWAAGELVAFSAWGGTLVYAGAFFVETYGTTTGLAGLVLGIGAAVYLPGNFLGRTWLERGGPRWPLLFFGLSSAGLVAAFGGVRPSVLVSAALFSALAFFSAGRTIAGASLGLELAEGRRLAAMSMRTAMQQFGYLVGSAIGGVVLAAWGYTAVGIAFGALWVVSVALSVSSVASPMNNDRQPIHER